MPETPAAAAAPPVHEALLRGAPAPSERRPASPWAYAPFGILLVSVFVLYHVSVLLVWNAPRQSLAKPFHTTFLEATRGKEYFAGTHNAQSWEMFAPNPTRANAFVRVFVADQHGDLWDFEQDIWEEDRYPYLWYDRRGKVNRRIDAKKHYQRIYGAWVCREWERQHGGEAAKRVTFVRKWTMVPQPQEVLQQGGWDQWQAPVKETEQETITCRTIPHGQLPNELRARYQLELLDDEDAVFRPVRQQTWFDELQDEQADESPSM